MASAKGFEDLDLSKEEVKRLGEALKDEKFRKMLAEYAEEISDPENRRKAEEEIAMMENERGMNVQFVHPKPGHVLKTTVDGTTKAFINICQNDKIDKPVAKREVGPTGKSGLMWQIPHSFAPPRDDADKSNKKCKVFDVVFHPDTYRMACNNERFRKLVEDTAIDGIEKQFNVSIDRKNMKHPKCKFKGQPVATVIRERIPDHETKPVDPDSILGKMPYPYDNKTASEKSEAQKSPGPVKENSSVNGNENKFTEPKYTITHRSEVDMSEYRNAPDAKVSTRPKELVIKIHLPLLKSSADASLDIFEKKLLLESVSPAAYKLDLNLPFPVNDDEGFAKFDKSKKTLTISLPVLPEKVPQIPFTHRGEGDSVMDKDEDQENNKDGLITVLSDTVNHDGDAAESSAEVRELNKKDTDGEVKSQTVNNGNIKLPENVKWLLPEYEATQDCDTISLVIKVQCVEEQSVSLTFPEPRQAEVKFMSIGAGCFPSYYSLHVEFCECCHISSEHSNVDISDDNLVLLLLKDKACRGLWDFFSVGTDKDTLEIKQFLTESNLKRELSVLDRAAEKGDNMPIQEQEIPEVSVLEMSPHKLTMEIKPKNKKSKNSYKLPKVEDDEDDEYDEYDPPSSAEIEVIHRQPAPHLHSILKQRTVSESSEDHSLTADLESYRSGEEDDLSSSIGKRRSVSFNSHVDRASFKASASVSSMAPTLKNKRKKQRKREEKIQRGRRHRNNSGTNSSSGEDPASKSYSSDSYSMSEEDGEESEKAAVRRAALLRANSDPGPDQSSDRFEFSGKKIEKVIETKEKKSGEVEKNAAETTVIPDSSKCLDFRTKAEEAFEDQDMDVSEGCESDSKNVMMKDDFYTQDKNKKMVEEIKGKLEAAKISDGQNVGEGVPDSDDDDEDIRGTDDCLGNETPDMSCERGSENDDLEDVQNEREKEAREKSNGVHGDGEKKDGSGGNKGDNDEVKEKSDVETMLSWNDTGINGDEYRTQCVFTFTNNLMFDLDVD